MNLAFHSKVATDIDQIMSYYEQAASSELADEFYDELTYYFEQAAQKPETFPIRERDIRRVNLARFPYHFLFRIVDDSVRILVVRHHKRDPSIGSARR